MDGKGHASIILRAFGQVLRKPLSYTKISLALIPLDIYPAYALFGVAYMQTDAGVGAHAQWASVVERIQRGDASGASDLYHTLSRSARIKLNCVVDAHSVDDGVHDVLVAVLEAIRRGAIREPERLMGFVRTVMRRRMAAQIRGNMAQRRRLAPIDPLELPAPSEQSPEAATVRRERLELIRKMLKKLCERDRELLIRFYLYEQNQEDICRQMGLTATQFRLYKSRAIARCSTLANRGKPSSRSTPGESHIA
jgi:RNA polymerase sigma-70 factor (ECF subfamily)